MSVVSAEVLCVALLWKYQNSCTDWFSDYYSFVNIMGKKYVLSNVSR